MGTFRYLVGLAQASIFSLVYLLTPIYFVSLIALAVYEFPYYYEKRLFYFSLPFLFSAIFTKPVALPNFVAEYLKPMSEYFQFESVHEISDDELRKDIKNGKNYILAATPHGVISFCGMCSAVNTAKDLRGINTAAASVLLRTPILKNIMGIYGLTDASHHNIKKLLQKKGIEGSIVLYVGGIAELFKSSRKEERLYLSKRKGFIKYALSYGVDVIPIYLFGNTSVLTVVKNGPIASLSRKLQMSVTYFWGKYNLPIPRDDKCLFVRGKPLGIPHIPNPTQEDIDKYHALYCKEVTRLFESYKEKVPLYKHKKLYID